MSERVAKHAGAAEAATADGGRRAAASDRAGVLGRLEQHLETVADLFPGFPSDLCLLVRTAALVERRMVEAGNAVLKPHGLTYPMYQVLVVAPPTGAGGITPGEIATMTGERATNVTHLCDELVRHGWMTRRRDASDRRRVLLGLTAAGRRVLAEVQPQMWATWRRRFAGLDAGERRALLALLRREHANLEVD
ncbi:MarR family winged helix-turn-helix transcriptional regulator [Anaeromyxobacter soli]|uniref:MarR family winged helix-turn-helix transcriptional regulator n=1 Tax=Anaeromyxobacter soli TaxID=2922725 RepID=UPI001FAF5984|nr:MarR family winged helix-turn-helix transcriptional regulator [Anaeromyxobacter sp. SG29]